VHINTTKDNRSEVGLAPTVDLHKVLTGTEIARYLVAVLSLHRQEIAGKLPIHHNRVLHGAATLSETEAFARETSDKPGTRPSHCDTRIITPIVASNNAHPQVNRGRAVRRRIDSQCSSTSGTASVRTTAVRTTAVRTVSGAAAGGSTTGACSASVCSSADFAVTSTHRDDAPGSKQSAAVTARSAIPREKPSRTTLTSSATVRSAVAPLTRPRRTPKDQRVSTN